MNDQNRCGWAQGSQLERDYHDNEWGVPVHDDRSLFELLNLESAQAGLSWITILNKRENYLAAFDNFEIEIVASYDKAKIAELLNNAGIVRNKLKVNATVNNAKRVIEVQQEFGSFDAYIWQFVGGKPKVNSWKDMSEVPANTDESDMMSKDLKKRGFKFMGTTICYAFMQASGMVNDHVTSCFCYSKHT